MKTFWNKFRDIFGLKKNSKYVRNFLNQANMRSALFMSAVIVALEVWLVYRQADKYMISIFRGGMVGFPYGWFQVLFTYTSSFWLLMSFGVTMFAYCLFFRQKKEGYLLVTIISAIVSLLLCLFIPYEFIFAAKPIVGVNLTLLITFYSLIAAFNLAVIIASIYAHRGGSNQAITSMLVITLFAAVCLTFGIKVSYGDFSSMKNIGGVYQINPDYKQIICFLMMCIYVACLLIWKPFVSLGLMGSIFLGFYLLLKTVENGGGRKFPDGDEVNYITFFISLTMICISIYDQRVSEAKKDEELELLATKDTLTGLWSFEYFNTLVARRIKEENVKVDEWVYLFMDIASFKIFNDQRGFDAGNKFLKDVGEIIADTFKDGLVTRQSDDHYVVFAKNKNIEVKIDLVEKAVEKLDLDIRPGIKVGGYILRDKNEDTHLSIEKARYALSELKSNQLGRYLVYDAEMHDTYRLIQFVVRHIDDAIEQGWIRPYYQPVVWSKGRKLCGAEALARWIDPRHGFLSPAKFVPALESAQLIYKLDITILRMVCQQIKDAMNNDGILIPVSINFSRIDFKVVDIVSIINETVEEFDIPKDLLHIEITESALTDNEEVLKDAIKRLHELGFAVWLDDFGSGYSSFNVLKDFEFDVLKLDMKFLSGFRNNQKSKFLIQSVVQMAEQIGMKTLSEGVETKEEAAFLEQISCGRLQGYLYGKPIEYAELKGRIDSGDLVLADELRKS